MAQRILPLRGAANPSTAREGTNPGSFANPADPFARRAYSNRSTEQSIEDMGASAEINWDLNALGGATLTSITAWRNWETVNGQDADFTTVDILYRDPDGAFGNEFQQLSEEIRLAGEAGNLTWLVGAFYADEDLDSNNRLIYGNQFFSYFNGLLQGALPGALAAAYAGGLGTRDVYEQSSQTWALFTNDSFRITDALELTVGLRYTNESKDLDTQYVNQHGGAGCTALRAAVPGLPAAAVPTVIGIGRDAMP